MDILYSQVPRSACSLLAERETYILNGSPLGSYLEVTSHTLVPVGLYPLEYVSMGGDVAHPYNRASEERKQAVSYQFRAHEGRVIHFPLDQQVQMQAFFHALSPDPVEVLECHQNGNRSYSSHYAVLDAGCTIEQLYHHLCSLYKERSGQHFPLSFPLSFQYTLYRLLWEVYFLEYPDLLRVAAEYDGFRDRRAEGSSRIHRPWNTYQDQLQYSPTASIAIANAVWHYQHYAIWGIPRAFRAVAQRYWRETHGESFPSDQFRLEILRPGELVVLASVSVD